MGFLLKVVRALLLVTLYQLASVSSARILLLMPIATKSETHLLNPIAKALVDRGHQVTLVTPASSSIKHENFTEIVPVKYLDMADFDQHNVTVLELRGSKDDPTTILYIDMPYVNERCHETYRHKDFEQVLQAESYDLVLTSSFFSECFLGLIYKLGAPYIQISSMPLAKHALDITGLRTPLSFVPCPFLEFTDNMSLSERLINALSSWSFTLLNYHHYFKVGEKIYKQYLGEDLPDVDTLRKNISLVFSNTHFSLNFPRATLPDVIEIGGVHCRDAKPLPKDIEDFVSGDKNGFILFSLGTVFREESMPASFRQIFINVFSRLKLRVLWKWKSDISHLIPSNNVKIVRWLPQQDVLGHPNLKLFISHGGLLSTQEATYHGKPVLGLPVFVDQDVNMKQVEARGFGLKLEILDLTEEILEEAIRRMLSNSSFLSNAKKASVVFRDQPETPLQRAVYWMEYVINHKGAPLLRSHARNLSYIEYHMYDIQLIFTIVLASIIIVAWKIISKILRISWAKADNAKRVRFANKNK